MLGLQVDVGLELSLFGSDTKCCLTELLLCLTGRFCLLLGRHTHFSSPLSCLLSSLLRLESKFSLLKTSLLLSLKCSQSHLTLSL